jgi:hypothetical protein
LLWPTTIMSTGPDEHSETMRVFRILKKALIYASLVSVALIVALILVFIAAGLLLPSKPVQSEEARTYEGLIRTLKNDGVLDQVVRIDCERLGPEREDYIDFYIRCEATLKNNAGTYVKECLINGYGFAKIAA